MVERQSIKEENIEEIRRKLISRFRDELPVLRARARISQETLAEKIGISRQTYSSIETGKREVTWTTFLALVAYFQNNEQIRQMIDMIEDFEKDMAIVMEGK